MHKNMKIKSLIFTLSIVVLITEAPGPVESSNVSNEYEAFVAEGLVSSRTFITLNSRQKKSLRGKTCGLILKVFQEREEDDSLTEAFFYIGEQLDSKKTSKESPFGRGLEVDENGHKRDLLGKTVLSKIIRASKQQERHCGVRKPIPQFKKSTSKEAILSSSGGIEQEVQEEQTPWLLSSSGEIATREEDKQFPNLLLSSGEFEIGEQDAPAPGFFSRARNQLSATARTVSSAVVNTFSYLFGF